MRSPVFQRDWRRPARRRGRRDTCRTTPERRIGIGDEVQVRVDVRLVADEPRHPGVEPSRRAAAGEPITQLTIATGIARYVQRVSTSRCGSASSQRSATVSRQRCRSSLTTSRMGCGQSTSAPVNRASRFSRNAATPSAKSGVSSARPGSSPRARAVPRRSSPPRRRAAAWCATRRVSASRRRAPRPRARASGARPPGRPR